MQLTAILKALILLPLFLALQSTFPFSIGGVRPDLFLILALHYGLRGERSQVAYVGFLCGLVQSVMTAGTWKVAPLSKGLITLFAFHGRTKGPWSDLGTRSMLLVTATIFDGILHAAALRPGLQALPIMAYSAALNVTVGLPLLALLDAVDGRLNATSTTLVGKR